MNGNDELPSPGQGTKAATIPAIVGSMLAVTWRTSGRPAKKRSNSAATNVAMRLVSVPAGPAIPGR